MTAIQPSLSSPTLSSWDSVKKNISERKWTVILSAGIAATAWGAVVVIGATSLASNPVGWGIAITALALTAIVATAKLAKTLGEQLPIIALPPPTLADKVKDFCQKMGIFALDAFPVIAGCAAGYYVYSPSPPQPVIPDSSLPFWFGQAGALGLLAFGIYQLKKPGFIPGLSSPAQIAAPSSGPSGLADLANEAFFRPIREHNLSESLRIGQWCVAVARPRMVVSGWVSDQFRKLWDKAKISRGIHYTAAFVWNVGAFVLRSPSITADQVRDWHPAPPNPQTLVKVRAVAETVNKASHYPIAALSYISQRRQGVQKLKAMFRGEPIPPNQRCDLVSLMKSGFGMGVSALNWGYRQLYKEDLLPPLPPLPEWISDIIFGNHSGQPFDERVDALFIASMRSNPEILNLGEIQSWLPTLCLAANDCKRVFQNAINQTLQETQAERRALIRAAEGVILSMIYKTITSKVPHKDVLIREGALAVFNQMFPARGLLGFLHSIAPNPLYWTLKQDFVESAATGAGEFTRMITPSPFSPLTATAAKQGVLQGTTVGLKFGPAIYKVVYEVLDDLAKLGNQNIEQFGMRNLWNGTPAASASSAAAAPVNADTYNTDIAAAFTLGTINRMCEGRGIPGVLKLAFHELMKKKDDASSSSTSSPSPPTPGMEEAKTAFHHAISRMRVSFQNNLCNSLKEEGIRQKAALQAVHTEIQNTRDSVFLAQAQAFSRATFGIIPVSVFLAILDPMSLIR